YQRVVLVFAEQAGRVEDTRVVDAELDEPPRAVGVFVDEFGLVDDGVVRLADGAAHGGEEFTDRLGRLDLTHHLAGLNGAAGLGQFDVDDVTELVGGEFGDSDRGGGAVDREPLVLARVFEVGGVGHL